MLVLEGCPPRIRETVDALLTLSKVQPADHPLVAGGVRLSALVRDCVQLIGAGAGERGVTIALNPSLKTRRRGGTGPCRSPATHRGRPESPGVGGPAPKG